MASISRKIYVEIGLRTLVESPFDTKILCLQRFVRLFGYGGSALILATYLSSLGFSDTRAGTFMTLTLVGDCIISLFLTYTSDKLGRRRMLALGSLLMSAGGIAFATSSNYWILLAASVFGVISPSGNEVGPFKAIEESTISQLVPSKTRSDVLAWYILVGMIGAAGGISSCGWIVQKLGNKPGWTILDAYRVFFWIYAALGFIKLILSLMLSQRAELEKKKPDPASPEDDDDDERQPLLDDHQPVRHQNGHVPEQSVNQNSSVFTSVWKTILPESAESRAVVIKLCFLFAMDSIASSLVPATWLTYFFVRKFGFPQGPLGTLFSVSSLVSAASGLAAPSIAKRIGLIKTMVFTHVPASLALALIPLPNNVIIAMALLILRASTNSMDQAPRQAFLAAAVLPAERTAVMGLVNVVKTSVQCVGPYITGRIFDMGKYWIVFVAAGALKLVYDVGLLVMFVGYKTQEERAQEDVEDIQEEEREAGRGDEAVLP